MAQLSNDENLQMLRYLDDDMSPQERTEFEVELSKNTLLNEAMTFEKKLLKLGQSAAGKVDNYFSMDEESRNEADVNMIKRARTNWENENDDGARFKNVSAIDETKNTVGSGGSQRLLKFGRIKGRKLLPVAASVLVIIILSVYFMNVKNNAKLATLKQKKDTVNGVIKSDSSFNQQLAKPKILKPEEVTISKEMVNDKLNRPKGDRLFSDNFKVDTIPSDIPDILQDAFAYYEGAQFKDAVAAFENVDSNFLTRGGSTDKQRARFYVHYYKGLSFLADKRAANSIPELLQAVNESPELSLTANAQWYLALANFKLGNVEAATALLKTLSSGHSKFRKRSAKVLDGLKQ